MVVSFLQVVYTGNNTILQLSLLMLELTNNLQFVVAYNIMYFNHFDSAIV